MTSKRGVNNSILLSRIDERTINTEKKIDKVDKNIGKLFDRIGNHDSRLAVLEDEHIRNIHIPREKTDHNKFAGFVLNILMKLIKWILKQR